MGNGSPVTKAARAQERKMELLKLVSELHHQRFGSGDTLNTVNLCKYAQGFLNL